MAKRVVDGLEVIEIEQDECASHRFGGEECRLQVFVHVMPVRQAGKLVMVGKMAQVRLDAFPPQGFAAQLIEADRQRLGSVLQFAPQYAAHQQHEHQKCQRIESHPLPTIEVDRFGMHGRSRLHDQVERERPDPGGAATTPQHDAAAHGPQVSAIYSRVVEAGEQRRFAAGKVVYGFAPGQHQRRAGNDAGVQQAVWRPQIDHQQDAEDQRGDRRPAPPVGKSGIKAEEPDAGRVDQAAEADLRAYQRGCGRKGGGLIERGSQRQVDREQQAEKAERQVHAPLSVRRSCERGMDAGEKADAAGNQQARYIQCQAITGAFPHAVTVLRPCRCMVRPGRGCGHVAAAYRVTPAQLIYSRPLE